MPSFKVTAVLSLLVAAAPLAAQEVASPEARVDAVFADYTSGTPGCTVGVERDGKTLLARGYGLADIAEKRPLTATSSVYMASVSKQVTALAVLLLVEEGKLHLDDRARSIVPELPAYADAVTVRQLLTHNAGLRDFFTLGAWSGFGSEHAYSEKDVLDLIGRQQSLDFVPDTDHLYSNSGYVMLSLIVQRVSGKKLDDFARSRIFAPLGMNQTLFQHDHTKPVPQKANGYVKRGESWAISNSNLDVVGDGGLYSTAPDMLRWIANMDSGKIGARSIALMRTSARLKDGRLTGYGMGLSPTSYRGLPLVQHSGGLAGYRTMTWWFPTKKLGIVISCNNGTARPGELVAKVANIYLSGALKPETVLTPIPLDASANVFAGVYRDASGDYFEAALRDGALVALRPDSPLTPVAPGVFAFPSDPDNTRLAFDSDGKAFRLVSEGGPERRFQRVEMTAVTADDAAAYVGEYRSTEVPVPFAILQADGLKIKIANQPELPLVRTGPNRLWAPDVGLEVVFLGDEALLNAGRARGLKFRRTRL